MFRVTAVKNIKGLKLTAEDDRFVNRLIKHGQRNGLDLPADVKQQIKVISSLLIYDFNYGTINVIGCYMNVNY